MKKTMLQTIREKLSGWVLFLIVGILIVPFAFLGIGDYFSSSIPTYVAKVGEDEIAPDRVRQALDRQRQQYRSTFGEEIDLSFLGTPEAKRRLLDQLVDQTLLHQDGLRAGIVVPPERLRAETTEIPAFQVAGQFDPDLYARVLAANNMTPRGFQAEQAKDITTREISTHLADSVGVSEAEVNTYLKLRDQKRSFDHLLLSGADEQIDETVTDEAIAALYEDKKSEYMRPERLSVDYVEIRGEALVAEREPTGEDLQSTYEEQKSRFVQPARSLTSHILVALASGADADAERAALQKAQDLRQRIVDGKESFEAVAREASEDPGSAGQGGDLGWIEPGLTDPAFEEALFALEAGAISEPVRGADGYHIIQAREVEPERGKSFEEVREELRTEWIADERYRAFNELAGRLLTAVNANPRSLQSAAATVELPLQRSELFSADQGEGMFADPRLRAAAFDDTVKERGVVGDPVQLSDEHVVVMQRAELVAAEPQPLAEVADALRARILADRRAAALKVRAEALRAQLAGGMSLASVAAELGKQLSSAEGVLRTASEPDSRIVREVFKLARPAATASRLELVELSEQELLVVELKSVTDGDPSLADAAARAQVREQLERHWSSGEGVGYLEFLRAGTDIEINESRIP
jgi:peptidyl-prolyl cis-trans isomerase D